MKKYVLIKGKEKNSKTYGGSYIEYKLYENKKGLLEFIGKTKICTRGWGGEEWVTMCILKETYPKSRTLQKCDNYGNGYITSPYTYEYYKKKGLKPTEKATLQVIDY